MSDPSFSARIGDLLLLAGDRDDTLAVDGLQVELAFPGTADRPDEEAVG